MANINNLRNIGISAHIDSGKTTLTERILFYCDKIHTIHEVKGKDGVGATMDSMELERERGITIKSAATYVSWKDININIIDTPGHVDFTIEVERALRVLDGAILVLSGVEGVQSQSITVDRQMRRYNVPRIAFINKLDRSGANAFKVTKQLKEKLNHNPVMMQIPIGAEDKLQGVVDLVKMKAFYFEGDSGEEVVEKDIPADLLEISKEYREMMIDSASQFSDELMEAFLEKGIDVDNELIYPAVRKGCLSMDITPVLMGSAYKNKGIQKLLDGVKDYLPCPTDVKNYALDLGKDEEEIEVKVDPTAPTIALAFKLEDGQYGQLTYIRVYQGCVKKGDELINVRNDNRKIKVGRLVKMHSDKMEEMNEAEAGEIAALFGIECASGDTFCSKDIKYSMTSMFVPEPVISLAIKAVDKKSEDGMSKALNRFTKEDPTFRTFVDPESNETIVQGMGELHLEVYIERMKREYKCEVTTGAPQVAYRETLTKRAEFDYTHKKQSGGSGQYGRVAGIIEPSESQEYEFVSQIKGGSIPAEYVLSCDKGFKQVLKKGPLIGFPIVGLRAIVVDGSTHPVDSSDIAFQLAAIGGFQQVVSKLGFEILEPIMKVVVEGPTEFQGNVFASINQKRGVIISNTEDGMFSTIEAEVPLSEMFGYSTTLRSLSQGKAEFSMEFLKYAKAPLAVQEELKKKYAKK